MYKMADRFQCYQFQSVTHLLELTYAGQILTEANVVKFLGLEQDNNLTWKTHIEHLLHKLSATCLILRKLFHVLNKDTLKNCTFRIFSFSSTIWHNCLGQLSQHKKGILITTEYIENNDGSKTEMFW
jgi:hypothetical protein